MVAALCGLTLLGLTFSFPASAQGAVSVSVNNAKYGTLGFYNGVFVNVTNFWSSTLNLVSFVVWKNNQGETVAVTMGGLMLASGANDIAFAPLLNPLTFGHYLAFVFVVDALGNPVSGVTTFSLYIS